jgi:hypothetical protein
MFADICNSFQEITKFDLLSYFKRYRDFMQNSYKSIYSYYNGNTEIIDTEAMNTLDNLIKDSKVMMRQFQTFSVKLGNVGYWELQEYCQNLSDTLDKVTKLPKFCRTSKSCRGYKPVIQVDEEIGGLKTVEDLADNFNQDYKNIILDNDLEESDYEIDELKGIKGVVDNKSQIVVETIFEQPIGERVYGKDLNRNISFSKDDNDLSIVKYIDNVEQKCDILLELERGDIPEFPNLGRMKQYGMTYGSFNYAEMMNDLQNTFLQDDLFSSIVLDDMNFSNGDLTVSVDIKTKYIYETNKTLNV